MEAPTARRKQSFRLSQFAPGDYVARAIISVEGRPVGRVARPFRIASATAPRH
jgi:hypothetical protein